MGAAEFDGDVPRHRRYAGGRVITAFLAGARPEVWVADRNGGQLGHGTAQQMCLAHLLRDTKYAIEAGDTEFTPGFRLLLLRAMPIGKRRERLADTTLARYHADLDRRLDRLLSGPMPNVDAGRKLFRAMRRDPPRRAIYQQRLRARAAPFGDLPQGDQRLPRAMGSQGLCRGSQHHRHRATIRAISAECAPGRPGGLARYATG